MIILNHPQNFEEFREVSRNLIKNNISPQEINFLDKQSGLFQNNILQNSQSIENIPGDNVIKNMNTESFSIRKEDLKSFEILSHHRSKDIWDLLYRVIWNLKYTGKEYLKNPADPDVIDCQRRLKQISRDIHKMHAFIRFKKINEDCDGKESFVAWHRPEHKIIRKGSIFFKNRFPNMKWTILSPDESVHWDCKTLSYGPGVSENPLIKDELEAWWLTYYEAIFNPARVKIKAMKNEMPTKYWESLPETKIITELLKNAPARIEVMQKNAISISNIVPVMNGSYEEIKSSLQSCKNCEISCLGGRPVFGEGNLNSEIMIVGEQIGDEEDKIGKVFIGPSGRLLNEIFNEIELKRTDVYITNAVKHFKWEKKGNKRIHKTPSGREILACRNWLLSEINLVKPKVIVCLGRIAAQSVIGIQLKISAAVQQTFKGVNNSTVLVTYHPSSILRSERENTELKNTLVKAINLVKS